MLVDAAAASPVLGFFGGRNGTPGKGTHCGREPVTVGAGVLWLPCTGDCPRGRPFDSSVNEPPAPTSVQGELRSS